MMLRKLGATVDHALETGGPDEMRAALEEMREHLAALERAERGPEGKVGARDHVRDHFHRTLKDVGIASGRVAELGGPGNSFCAELPDYEFEFLSIYADPARPEVHVADITHCPQIPDETYDAVFSVAVMEHVARPWAAAREIRRILKPGGVVYHAAPFSYFFHGAPSDYWRFTPEAFKQLFEDFEVLHGSFYSDNRRRNNLGSASNPVDGDGGPQFAEDAFGGWRENWMTLFAARKSDEAGRALHLRRRRQLAVDAVTMLAEDGVPDKKRYRRAAELIALVRIGEEGELRRRRDPGPRMRPQVVRSVWLERKELGLSPGPDRAVLRALVR